MVSRLILRFIFRLLNLFLCSLLMPRLCVMSITNQVFMMRLETMYLNTATIRMICRISSRILLRVKLRQRRPDRKGLLLNLRIHRLNHLTMILSRFISVLVRCHVRARAVARVPARVLPDGLFSKIRTYEFVRTFLRCRVCLTVNIRRSVSFCVLPFLQRGISGKTPFCRKYRAIVR